MVRLAVCGSLVLLFIGCASCTAPRPGGPAGACPAPSLLVARYAKAGGTIEVKGSSFMDDCADTGGPPAHGLTGITVVLEQGENRWPLTTVDAREDQFSFDVSVTVPPAAATGPATITATPDRAGFRPAVAPITINK
jgi:hypothetical protein